VSRGVLADAVKRGDLDRLFRDVYADSRAVPHDPRDHHLFMALAHQVRSPQLIASHETAALAHSMFMPNPHAAATAEPRFTALPRPGRRTMSAPRTVLRELPDDEVTTLESGLRVTTPARTAVDLAAELPLPQSLMLLDDAARRRAMTRARSDDLRGPIDAELLAYALMPLARAAETSTHRRTRRRVQTALSLVDPRRESPSESFSFGHIFLSGLPLPDLQVPIVVADEEFFSDFGWEEFKLVAEMDGAVKYGRLARINAFGENTSLVKEARRERLIRGVGWDVIRWLFSAILKAPATVMRQLEAALVAHGYKAPRVRRATRA
jgi:very-short-patch-repair endonuclease